MANTEKVSFETDDGWTLTGRLHVPEGDVAAVVLVSGGTGISCLFYRHFAAWCARKRGAACLIYDYRDFGLSAKNPVAKSPVQLSDWALEDQSAAIRFMLDRFGGHKVTLVGHSLGGMMLQYQSARFPGQIERAITVASGTGYWLGHPWWYLPMAVAFWHVLGPVTVAALGFLRGGWFGLGTDMPSGVFFQWRRWCTSAEFYRADIGRQLPSTAVPAPVSFPVRMFAFDDDYMIPAGPVRALSRFFSGDVTVVEISPKDHGLKRIGHVHAFARSNEGLWATLFD